MGAGECRRAAPIILSGAGGMIASPTRSTFPSPGALSRLTPEMSVAAKLLRMGDGSGPGVTGHPQDGVAGRVEQSTPLARLTTVGIGGPALVPSRDPRRLDRPRAASRLGARGKAHGRSLSGLGSNVLAADTGIDGLVRPARGRARRGRDRRHTARRRRWGAERRELFIELVPRAWEGWSSHVRFPARPAAASV